MRDTAQSDIYEFVVAQAGFTGYPDGCTMAADDTLFVSFWAGSCVSRYDLASGALIKKYSVPGAEQTTACAFGGECPPAPRPPPPPPPPSTLVL